MNHPVAGFYLLLLAIYSAGWISCWAVRWATEDADEEPPQTKGKIFEALQRCPYPLDLDGSRGDEGIAELREIYAAWDREEAGVSDLIAAVRRFLSQGPCQ